MNKVFIIGLPRTGTTSLCVALLDQGLKVAHTAYTKQTFELADVLADTPCFCDYQQLDKLFPHSKFVYLDRKLELWIPSMQMLLTKIQKYLKPDGHFHPVIKRCFNQIFELPTTESPSSESHLTLCYLQHQQQIFNYFSDRTDLLTIDVSDKGSLTNLLNFIGLETIDKLSFPHLNSGRLVTTWRDIKHPNKINSNAIGPERRKFFGYVR